MRTTRFFSTRWAATKSWHVRVHLTLWVLICVVASFEPLSQIVFKALNPAASWLPRIPFNRSQRLSLIWLPVTAGVYALVRWGVEVSQPSSWLLTVGNRHNFLFFWFVVLSPPVLAYITHLLSVIQIQKSCCLYDTSIFNCRRQIPL